MILFLLIINFFYRNYNITNEIVYETKDKLSRITFGDVELLCKTTRNICIH